MFNQTEAILNHLQHIGPITPIEALNLYGIFRLGARAWDLRQQGHDVITDIIHANGKHFASYRLKEHIEEIPVKTIEIPQGKQAQMAFAL